MEGITEEAIHHTALKLAEEIKNLSLYKSFYSDVQVRISRSCRYIFLLIPNMKVFFFGLVQLHSSNGPKKYVLALALSQCRYT